MALDTPRVAIDVAPVRPSPTGVGTYVRRLVNVLRAQDEARFPLIGARAGSVFDDDGVAVASRFRWRHYHAWLQRCADGDVRRTGASLVHYTNAAAPLRAGRPYVLTVHDLSVLRHPRYHPPLRLATLPLTLAAVRGARALIVPSTATRQELVRLFHVDREGVFEVPHGRDAERQAPDPLERRPLLDELRLEEGRFILTTGTLEPRKNHGRLIQAFTELARADPGLRLVIAGAPGWGSKEVLRAIRQAPFPQRIVVTGYLPERDVDILTGACAAFVYVSLYEGFGLPIVEAMSIGAPVVTSGRSAMPEAAGGAAVLVDPLSPASIAAGIRRAVQDGARLRSAGQDWAAERPWSEVGRETVQVYDRALG
ncbi:MAG: glycosyltransferase family 4 protein [Chloroflexi bacterium]|nr:glycosyltransferase family 4 protein [Chloroflexota bacterium]